MSTAVVSVRSSRARLRCLPAERTSSQPVMVIRRIDSGAIAVGGGTLDGYQPPSFQTDGLSWAPGESLGEPVSQHRPLCLEIYSDVLSNKTGGLAVRPGLNPNTFLGSIDDTVSYMPAPDPRSYLDISPPSVAPFAVPSSVLPFPSPGPFAAFSFPASTSSFNNDDMSADDGAKVKRARKMASSSNLASGSQRGGQPPSARPSGLFKPRRRVQSMNSVVPVQAPSTSTSRVWKIDCGGESFLLLLRARATADRDPMRSQTRVCGPLSLSTSLDIPFTSLSPSRAAKMRRQPRTFP
jgi:hypothetical protein